MRTGPLASMALGVFLTACAPAPGPPAWGTDAEGAPAYPFAPASVRIFPLTRIDTEASGRPLIVCHVEFRDAWGDSVKAAGRLRITMTGALTPPGGARRDLEPLAWDIDLSDLEKNSRLYDRATRTYRIQLVDVPAELSPGAGPEAWRVALHAAWSVSAAGPPALEDDYVLVP